jgi:hypothetical protein
MSTYADFLPHYAFPPLYLNHPSPQVERLRALVIEQKAQLDFVQFCIRDRPLAASDSSHGMGFLPGLRSRADV